MTRLPMPLALETLLRVAGRADFKVISTQHSDNVRYLIAVCDTQAPRVLLTFGVIGSDGALVASEVSEPLGVLQLATLLVRAGLDESRAEYIDESWLDEILRVLAESYRTACNDQAFALIRSGKLVTSSVGDLMRMPSGKPDLPN